MVSQVTAEGLRQQSKVLAEIVESFRKGSGSDSRTESAVDSPAMSTESPSDNPQVAHT